MQQPNYINVCQLLEREFLAIEAQAQTKDLTLTVKRCPVPAAECTHFFGDPVRIGEIVKNVLLNAVRYTPPGGSISVDCSRRADELEIRIADSGPGIAPQEAERVFEAGQRGTASSNEAGSGYGLTLVRRFVEEHGGEVTVGSSTAGGASFLVRLPGTLNCISTDCAGCSGPNASPR